MTNLSENSTNDEQNYPLACADKKKQIMMNQ